MISNILANILGLKRKDFVVSKIVFWILFYLIMLLNKPVFFVILSIFFVITIFAFFYEKSKTVGSEDSFEDDNLFYRYGTKITSDCLPLRLEKKIDNVNTDILILELKDHLVESMKEEIDYRIKRGTHKTELIEVHDRHYRSDLRFFTRFSYTGQRGGEINHFILLEYIGSYIALHFDSFYKGVPHWYDKALFLLTSPYKIWFWFIPWLRNDFSILVKLSRYLDNSFEFYDLESYYVASRFVILDSIKDFLKEKGLLSKELEGMIINQIIMNQSVVNKNKTTIGSNNAIGAFMQKIN